MNYFLNKVEILSLNEMPKIYEQNIQNVRMMPKTGEWVRIKTGVYEKDVGIVDQ